MIVLRTRYLEVEVDESKGAEITRLARPGGVNRLAWIDSDWPLRAGEGGAYYSADIDWLSEHRGGWQEMFPNAGAGCVLGGVPHPVHGEASAAPWEVIDRAEPHELTLRCFTHTPLVLTRRMRLDPARPRLDIEESIENRSELPFPYAWGHHPAFAAPSGTRLELGPARYRNEPGLATPEADLRHSGGGEWPWWESREGTRLDLSVMPNLPAERVLYLTELARTEAHILRPDTGDRLTLRWRADAFPYAWVWINRYATRFPWFGRLSSIAVEPVNVWPADGLAAAVERGQAPILKGGASRRGWLVVLLSDSK